MGKLNLEWSRLTRKNSNMKSADRFLTNIYIAMKRRVQKGKTALQSTAKKLGKKLSAKGLRVWMRDTTYKLQHRVL